MYSPMHKSPRPISQGDAPLRVASIVSMSQSRKSHQKVAPISAARKRSCKRMLRRVFPFIVSITGHIIPQPPPAYNAPRRGLRVFNVFLTRVSRMTARRLGILSASGRRRQSRRPSPRRKGARRTSRAPCGETGEKGTLPGDALRSAPDLLCDERRAFPRWYTRI